MKYMVYAVVALLAAIMFLFLILREKEEPINPSARLESVEKLEIPSETSISDFTK